MVLCWLNNSIEDSLASSLHACDTPLKLWEELEARFKTGNKAHKFRLKREIATTQQNNSTITKYYQSMKKAWDELDTMRSVGTLQDIENEKAEERVFELLMGLNDSYNQIKSKILAMDPFPSLGRVFHMLRDEEDQRAIKSIGHLDHSAMAVFKGQNQSGQATEEPPLKCTYCDKEGHDRSGCFRLIGFGGQTKIQKIAIIRGKQTGSQRANNPKLTRPGMLRMGQFNPLMEQL